MTGKCQNVRLLLGVLSKEHSRECEQGEALFPPATLQRVTQLPCPQTSWLVSGWKITQSGLLFILNGIFPWLANAAIPLQ